MACVCVCVLLAFMYGDCMEIEGAVRCREGKSATTTDILCAFLSLALNVVFVDCR